MSKDSKPAAAGVAAVSPEPTPVGARMKALCDRLCIVELNPDGEPQWEAPAEPEPLYFDSPEDAIVGYVEMLGKECDRLDSRTPATAEVLEGLKRDVLAELRRIRQEWWKSSVAENLLEDAEPRLVALFDAAAQKEPTK